MNRVAPGMWLVFGRRRAMTWSTEIFRSCNGLSEANMRAVLVVLKLPPVKLTTSLTAGSADTMRANSRILSLMATNEMSCSAWMLPNIRPASCWGKNPLGTSMKR